MNFSPVKMHKKNDKSKKKSKKIDFIQRLFKRRFIKNLHF